jgi:carotenoid cleavage dioxygenase-like enzyme
MTAGHWFDGDGFNFGGGFYRCWCYRRLSFTIANPRDIKHKQKADKFLYSNYGMTAPVQLCCDWSKPVKNAANTSV